MSHNEYKVVKLASGEEVIGRVTAYSSGLVTLHRPAVVVIDHQNNKMYLVPFMPYLEGEEVQLHETVWGIPMPEIVAQYEEKFFPNSLIVPDKKLIIPGK